MQLEKVTKQRQSEAKRSYEDACGLAHALELIGERWAPLVLRELWLGPRRFSELKADLPGISANVLTQRLGELEERGLVRRKRLPPPASVQVYEATEWTLEAAPILCELGRWASRSPRHEPAHRVSSEAIMLSIRTNFDPQRAGDFTGTLVFRLGDCSYFARVRERAIHVGRGERDDADAVITCSPDDLKPVLYGGAPVDALGVEGDIDVARRFMTLFALPAKVEVG